MPSADLRALFALDAPALVAVATDPAEAVERRRLAVGRLGTCEQIPPSPAVRAALARVASEDPDPAVRDLAAAGLRRREAPGLRLVPSRRPR